MNTTRADPPPPIVEWSRLLQLRELLPPGQPDVVVELIGDFLTDSERRIKLLHEAAEISERRTTGAGHLTGQPASAVLLLLLCRATYAKLPRRDRGE